MKSRDSQSNKTATISVDANGYIVNMSGMAAAWWAVDDPDELCGLFLGELFVLDVFDDTRESESHASEWEVLLDTSMDSFVALTALPLEGEAFAVDLRLRPEGKGFVAEIRKGGAITELNILPGSEPDLTPGQPPPATPASDPPQAGSSGFSGTGPPFSFFSEESCLAFYEINLANGTCRFSKAWKQLLGYEGPELEDRHETLIKLIHPEDSNATPDQPEGGAPGEKRPFSTEFRMRHKNGHYIWVQSLGMKHFDAGGRKDHVAGIHMDIQDRKEVEEEALLNEDRFLTFVQRGGLALFDLDFRHRQAYYSPSWQRLLGYDPGDFDEMPDTFRQFLIDPGGESREWPRIFADEQDRPILFRDLHLRTKDGSFVSVPVRLIRVTNRRGDLLRVLGILWEEPSPSSSESDSKIGPVKEMFPAVMEVNHEGIILADPDARIITVNPTARRLTGLVVEEPMGQPLGKILCLFDRTHRLPVENPAHDVMATGKPVILCQDYLLRTVHGEFREIVLCCHPIRDSLQKILGTAILFRDPGEMNLTPRELVESNRLQVLGLLAGGIAHDFNNLLTTILGGVSLSRETHETGQLERVENACVAAKNLIRQLLVFAREPSPTRKAANLEPLIRDSVRLASAGSKVKTFIDIPDSPHPVEVDSARMNQVFANLVVNAVEAMDEKGGALTVSVRNVALAKGEVADLPPGDHVMISFADEGPGIPSEMLDRIFEPFHTTKKQRTGLGLSTVWTVVRDHHGHVTVSSYPGEGTTFTVYLAAVAPALDKEDNRIPAAEDATGRILFMDDNPDILEVATEMLRNLEYQFDLARNGEEAIALYQRQLRHGIPYDAVILDLTIANGMGGEEAFLKIKDMDPGVRAIVSSGYNSEETADYFLAKGFKGILAKPYRSGEMDLVLRQVMGRGGPDLNLATNPPGPKD